jgi:hypothetical protein
VVVNIKAKTSLIILGTLIIGLIVGALAHSVIVRFRMDKLHAMAGPRGPHMLTERLLGAAGPLELEQKAVAKQIIEETGEQIHDLIEASRSQMDAVVDSMMTRLDSVLDDQQIARMRKAIGSLRAGPPPSPGDMPPLERGGLPPRPGGALHESPFPDPQ